MKPLFHSLIVALSVMTATAAAKDFTLETLPHADKPTFDLGKVAGRKTYYDLVHEKIAPKMQDISGDAQPSRTNESELENGSGVSVKLNENNYNVHINFPNAATGGRSYGWTAGEVGDWSDRMYLDNVAEVTAAKSTKDIRAFYVTLIEMLGASNAESLDGLKHGTQRVATNFLAIYTAEQYRSLVPKPFKNWDDALLETTLLAAFHGGQSTFTKFYLGEFSAESKKQGPGVYARTRPGPNANDAEDKAAEMNDYWQFSANPDSKQSGINISRKDFELMGEAITRFESQNRNMAKIQKIVGETENVIKAISNHFTEGEATVAETEELANLVADFMMDLRADADKITKWESRGER